MTIAPPTFGAQLRATRVSRGLTAQALADLVGIDRGYLSKIELGADDPSTDLVLALTDALEVDEIAPPVIAPASRRVLPLVYGTAPRTRGDCVDGPRPCAWECRWRTAGGADSCILDIADRGDASPAEIGAALGMTRQAAEQAEARALRKLATTAGKMEW